MVRMLWRRSVSSLEEPFQNGFVTSEIDRKRGATKAGNPMPFRALATAKLAVPKRAHAVIIVEVRNTKTSG
jgi:hypothetical protein